MAYSNTHPEYKIKQWSLVIQPSNTPALNENHASEETCTEKLQMFCIFFSLNAKRKKLVPTKEGFIYLFIY